MDVNKEILGEAYRVMVTIRFFEEKVAELFEAGQLPGFVHLYAGEEAIAAGVCAHLTDRDYITSTHRGHGHCIAKGVDLKGMMAELFGRVTGSCRGKGGSMHIADVDKGMLGANGIVGAGGPLACGSGLMAKTLGTDQVTACFFGDGASEQGTLHEAMNLACIWSLPVVFVCENNGYAEATPVQYHCAAKNVSDRGAAYDMPAVTVDGADFFAVYEAAKEAIERARRGEGPSLVECRAFRYYGHYQGDAALYFTEEEKSRNRARDPIQAFKKKLLERRLLTEAQLNDIETKTAAQIEEAVKFAGESLLPEPHEVQTDVYVNYP